MRNFDIDTEEGMANSIMWQEQLISLVNEGGKWGVPRSNAVYTIYKSKKIAVATARDKGVDKVFEAMGWEVREEI